MNTVAFEIVEEPEPEPTFWAAIGDWLVHWSTHIIAAVAIVVGAFLLTWILRLIIRRIVERIVTGAKNKANVDDTQALERSPLAAVRIVQRTRTLGSILQNIVNVTVVVIAIMLLVQVFAPGILGSLTLLTAAVGAGLGFGAQNIVKDVLNGIFIVAEDQIGIGDVVDLGLATGVVEYVSVRVTHVRDVNGTLWFVRNGEVTRIGNMSQGWSRIIVDVTVPADVDLDQVETTMLATATELANDPRWRTRVVEMPEIWGLETVNGDTLVTRLTMKARSNAKDDVARELRMRLKRDLESLGVDVPQLATVNLTGHDGAQRVRGANPPRTKPTPISGPPSPIMRPVWNPKPGKKAPENPEGSA